jgi:hypothetical protein
MATIPKNIIGQITAMTIHEVLRLSWDVKLLLNSRLILDVNFDSCKGQLVSEAIFLGFQKANEVFEGFLSLTLK